KKRIAWFIKYCCIYGLPCQSYSASLRSSIFGLDDESGARVLYCPCETVYEHYRVHRSCQPQTSCGHKKGRCGRPSRESQIGSGHSYIPLMTSIRSPASINGSGILPCSIKRKLYSLVDRKP